MNVSQLLRWAGVLLPLFLNVCFAQSGPTISTQPQSNYVVVGDNITISVVATASSTITYQWRFNGQNIAGANNASLTINNVQTYHDGTYSVVVTADSIAVTSRNAILTVLSPPVINTQPLSKTVVRGQSFSLYVWVSGSSPMTYQWKKGGANIANATSYYYDAYNTTDASAGSYTVTVTNAAGSVTSDPAVVTIVAPITFTTQPTSQMVDAGATVTLTGVVSGPGTIQYQWYKDGNSISGATAATLSLANVTGANSGSYTLYAYNQYPSSTVYSQTATVTVKAVPVITSQPPATANWYPGNWQSLSVYAAGAGPLSYQWKRNGVALVNGTKFSGVTSNSLSASNLDANDAGSYTVVVTNAYGSVTSTATEVTMLANPNFPSITEQPANQSAVVSGSATFSVTATGPAWTSLSYQWRKGGTNISGQTSRTLTLTNLTTGDAATYTVVVTNSYGSVTSNPATLTVLPNTAAPSIVQQPASATIYSGETLTLSVNASGNPSPTYQWRKDGTPINGATGSTLSLSNAKTSDAGAYSVVVSNNLGSVTSADAVVSVLSKTRVVNLSARAFTGTNAEILIAGFVIGSGPAKKMLIRAVGPSLAKLQVNGALSDPFLKIISQSGETIASNDDWEVTGNLAEINQVQAAVGAFPLNSGSKDSALVVTLQPGAYTALVSGNGNTTGIALAELYEIDDTAPNQLVNISARALVATGAKVLIPGVVVRGSGSKKFVIRAVGPGLTQFSVPGVLANPKIELVGTDGKTLASNDDWGTNASLSELTSAMNTVGAFSLQNGSSDSAMLVTLDPGSYTVLVSGVGNTSGVALVEVYQLP